MQTWKMGMSGRRGKRDGRTFASQKEIGVVVSKTSECPFLRESEIV